MSAFSGVQYAPIHGGQHDVVRGHINEKLTKYKVPLIIALDFFDAADAFSTVEEVMLGREVFHVPIDLSGSGKMLEPRAGRAGDGLLVRLGDDGQRARSRLQAALVFGFQAVDSMAVRARVLANPAAPQQLRLTQFAPRDRRPRRRRLRNLYTITLSTRPK
jgi:hypothetical protein